MSDLTTVRWGILGAGSIAKKFTAGVQVLTDAKVVAVGSRSQAKADEFANEFDIPNRHATYEALVSDPEVDIIYVATPHPMHREHSLLALNAGKPVLSEKPFTVNLKQAQEVVAVARDKKLFLMEGMWTRFFPIMFKVRDLLADGAIGEPRMLQADFGFRTGIEPSGRLFDPALAGGALLDVGIYPLSLSYMVFGQPDRISGVATIGETRVDEQSAAVLGYPGGQISIVSQAVRTNTEHAARIYGTHGNIVIHSPWWKPERMTVTGPGGSVEELYHPVESSGFQYEAQHVGECLRAGKLESDVMPLDQTLQIMSSLDTLRAKWGLSYPME